MIEKRPPITVGNSDSFAVEDVRSQAKRVIDIILTQNNLPKFKRNRLLKLQQAVLQNYQIDQLYTGNDNEFWYKLLHFGSKRKWFDGCCHGLVISYFHRLVLDKIDYFQTRCDPYLKIKNNLLKTFLFGFKDKKLVVSNIEELLDKMLWGNKIDLVPPRIERGRVLLTSHKEKFLNFLISSTPQQIDIIADNAGCELVYDLLFMHYVIMHKLTKRIRYHVKNYPYNITDTTLQDFIFALDFLKNQTLSNELRVTVEQICDLVLQRKIEVITYPFSTVGLSMEKIKSSAEEVYKNSSLVIMKGDFNYRKTVGWWYWNYNDDYEKAVKYMGIPMLCLRVIKHEILLGLEDFNRLKILNKNDPDWWKKGVGGMIIFSLPPVKTRTINKSLTERFWV